MALILWDGAGIYVFTTVVKKALQLNVKPLTVELSQVGTCGKEAMVFVCFGSLCGFPPGLWVFKHIWTKRLYKWKLDIKVNTDLQLSVLSVGRVFLSWIPLNFLFMNESSNCCGSKYDTLNPQFWSWVCMGMGLCEMLLYFYFFFNDTFVFQILAVRMGGASWVTEGLWSWSDEKLTLPRPPSG